MDDLRIRFNEVTGDSAAVEIATRGCHLTVAELERSLVSMGLRVVRSRMWLGDRGFCPCLYVVEEHEGQPTGRRTAEILATLLTALEPRLLARGRRNRDRTRADYLT
jgi:hypothetical protein